MLPFLPPRMVFLTGLGRYDIDDTLPKLVFIKCGISKAKFTSEFQYSKDLTEYVSNF